MSAATSTLLVPLEVKKSGHGVGCFAIYDANGSSLGIDFEEDTARAIVTACNSHAQLIEALGRLTNAVEFMRTMGAYRGGSLAGMGELDRAEEEARAAIKAALSARGTEK